MKFPSLLIILICALPIFLLSGCGDRDEAEVKQRMADIRRETKVVIPKLAEPKKFVPFAYSGKDAIDPYNPTKLAVAFAKAKAKSPSASTLKPDLDRRREPLEEYPLDALTMVGTMQKANINYALLRADKSLFRVKVGNYIGQNLGKITNITDATVELTEIVQDSTGDWVERKAKLELQETQK